MSLLDEDEVRAFLAEEIPSAEAWAASHGLDLEWDDQKLVLSLRLDGASADEDEREHYLLVGTFEDYRVMPPTWRFTDPRTGEPAGQPAYPLGNWPNGSVFHTNGLVCAPWSRDAYAERSGPHGEWTDASKWQSIAPQHTQANTIADMLARIHIEVKVSLRRMAPLPPLQEAAA